MPTSMRLTRCHECQLKPDFQKLCYTYGQLSHTETQWSINLICKRHQTLSHFHVRIWPWKTIPRSKEESIHRFCICVWYFLCNTWVNNQTLTEYWTYSLLCCNWFMAPDGWQLLYLVPVSACNLFIWWDCVTEAGFVLDTSEGCYRCTL